jgi:mannose-6-phosphate isomerase-like protein (cupin superfamily)
LIITRLGERPQFVAGDGTHLRELLHPAHQPAEIPYSLAHAVVGPGEASVPHRLRDSEVYYILSGSGVMHIEGEQAVVTTGTTIYVPPDAIQHIENTGPDELVFLCIVYPAWRAEDEEIV